MGGEVMKTGGGSSRSLSNNSSKLDAGWPPQRRKFLLWQYHLILSVRHNLTKDFSPKMLLHQYQTPRMHNRVSSWPLFELLKDQYLKTSRPLPFPGNKYRSC